MSLILNQLKRAEAERERLIAERKRVETEADAALGEREREEVASQAPPAPRASPAPPAPRRGLGLVLLLAVVVIIFYAVPDRKIPEPVASTPRIDYRYELRLERNAEGFAARAREKEPK